VIVLLSDPPPAVCVIRPEDATQADGLKRLLSSDRAVIAPAQERDWAYVDDATIDDAYFDVWRRQCGYVAGASAALKNLVAALRREHREYKLAPVWFDEPRVAQTTSEAKDEREQEIRKQDERQRASRERDQLEAQRKRDQQQQKTQIEEELRRKNGVRARALKDEIDALVKQLAEDAKAGQSETPTANARDGSAASPPPEQEEFPAVFNWLKAQNADHWETFDISSEIADYGNVQWHGRAMDAIIVRTVIQQKNRILGEYGKTSFMLGLIDDPEFSMQREIFNTRCDDSAPVIEHWKIGNSFKSQWNAD